MMIKSINYSQHDIIKDIITLHSPTGIELDPTYGRGNFYKHGVPEPYIKMDINPLFPDVIKADCRHLPLRDSSVESIIFDPPFLATRGPSLSVEDDRNIIAKRFGVYPTESDLHNFYTRSISEFKRVLTKYGILVFKCQDKVSSGTQYMSHAFILSFARSTGFYPKDLFILLSKNRVTAKWQTRNQKHARKFHAYFLVLEKSNRIVNYIR